MANRSLPLFCRLAVVCFIGVAVLGQTLEKDHGWYTEGDYAPVIRVRVILSNPLDSARRDCPVIIPRPLMPLASLEQTWVTVVDPGLPSRPRPTLEELRKIGSGAALEETNGHAVPYQLDDLDKDGIWDELFFMTDFKPGEEKTMFIYIGPENERGGIPHETHAGMGTYGRHLVPWWESKYMGWKLWYPNSIDLYGKRKPMLVANLEGSGEISGYTAPYEYGNDIMTVSDTFGAGGICLFEDPSDPDRLSRPRFSPDREKGPIFATRFSYDVVVNGPLRSIIRGRTMNWRTGRGEYEVEELYTAYMNKSYSTCRVHYLKFFPEKPGVEFGCGIRKMMQEYASFVDDGLAISMARNLTITDPDVNPAWETKITVDFMGIALVVKDDYRPCYRFVPSLQGSHTMRMPLTKDLTYEYLIAAGWSDGTVNRTEAEFKQYVLQTQKEYNAPIVVRAVRLEKKSAPLSPRPLR